MEFRTLRADEIDCRVAQVTEKGCRLLLYKDARCDMNILDETVGPEYWQRVHPNQNKEFCDVSIFIEELNTWVTKEDVGKESYTEKEKGQASDSFKRACFNWGIGRELYTAPRIWIYQDGVNLQQNKGKYTTYDEFRVRKIEYEDHKIISLVIRNEKLNRDVFTYNGAVQKPVLSEEEADRSMTEHIGNQKIDQTKIASLEKIFEKYPDLKGEVFRRFNLTRIEDMTEFQHKEFIQIVHKKK